MAASTPMPMVGYQPANFVRTIKLRSDLDAVYKPSYNRMQFTIDPDDMSSDLSESYLAFRMYLTHQSGTYYTKQELIDLAAKNTYVSFGQGGATYSPACLVKLCRLFTGHMQLLEETNFQNVLSETLAQLAGDFESVASGSLASNSSVVFGSPQSLGAYFANILPDAIGTGQQLPIEVHLPLHKLFGFFKHKNVYLDDPSLGGLRIWLELEDRKPLLQAITCASDHVCPPKGSLLVGGLEYTLSVNPYCSLTGQNDVGQMTRSSYLPQPLVPSNTTKDASGNQFITPQGSFVIQSDQIISFFNQNPLTATDEIVISGTWSADALTLTGLVPDNYVKLNFRLHATGTLAGQRQDQIVSHIATIDSVTQGQGSITVKVSDAIYLQWVSTQWVTTLDTVEVMKKGSDCIAFTVPADETEALITENSIKVDAATYASMKACGLISSDDSPTDTPFVLQCQLVADASNNLMPTMPYFDQFNNADVPSSRRVISNNTQTLPIQGSSCKIVGIQEEQGDYVLTFNDLGMFGDNSLQNIVWINTTFYSTGDVYNGDDVTVAYRVFFTSLKKSLTAIPSDDYSYAIDKAELVLVQQAKDKTVPMSRVYSTWRVEVATIETPLPIYQRQFLVTEPNCYSILLCMPQYSDGTQPITPGTTAVEPQSLISFNRGVQAYRWSINNIDDTNRDLYVSTNTSYYPSSLHLEKLMDALSVDGEMTVKSLSGILTVPHSVHPVVCPPLKVYDVREGMSYVMKPEGYQVQITLYGDVNHNKPVTPGPIFLFKHCLKMLP